MYLVREKTDPSDPGEVEIWFGNRMYATNKKDDISCGTFQLIQGKNNIIYEICEVKFANLIFLLYICTVK